MNRNNIQQATFWGFLKNHKIEIPIIQRDYAQGRIGKEKLRKKFLIDLKKALAGVFPKGEKALKLDFVYGSVENDRLNPLDGQQRLTTLWLLHWYIAYKADMLSVNKDVFKRFSYETRTSSREFCEKLSGFEFKSEKPIVEQILNQTWFFSVWKQDPTIQAMLNMLGGTPITDSKENDILDGIEDIFNDNCDYSGYWTKLIGDDCPIVFYYLDLEGLSLSDDLYIKMNARGKSLTNFENFKADLVGFIKDNEWENEWKKERIKIRLEKEGIEKQNEISKEEDNPNKTISHKLDVDWTNIFWKYRSDDHQIDEIYFAFINRYFLNSLITAKKEDESDLYTQKEIESNKLFEYLYGEKGDDSAVKYNSFNLYTSAINVFDDKLIERLAKTLDNFCKAFQNTSKEDINSLFMPSWDNRSNFRFIPEYLKNPKLNDDYNAPKYISATLTLPQRVVFYAVCGFFEHEEFQYDENNFKHWMRIVWNIVENGKIETIQSMIGAIRLIDDLVNYSHDIYEHLKDRDVSKDFANEQMEEEKEKAKLILSDLTNDWEHKIIEAESFAFFKGAIRFLFRTEPNIYDWNKFENRLYKAKNYFSKEGVVDIYKKDAILLRSLISQFSEFEHFKGEIFDNNPTSWKTVLLNWHLISILNKFFDIPDILATDLKLYNSVIIGNDKLRDLQNDLCKSTILNCVSSKSYFHWWNKDRYSLFPYNTKSQSKIFVLADKRNQVISALDNVIIDVDNWQRVEGLPYFKGWELYFTLKSNNKKYQWWNSLKEQTETGEWKDIPEVNLDNLEMYLKEIIT